MGFFFIIDYIVSFIVLLVIKAPWWAWLIYIGSALFWFVVWALIDGGTNEKTANSHKTNHNEPFYLKSPIVEVTTQKQQYYGKEKENQNRRIL